MITMEINFQTLRDQWALKAPTPDAETCQYMARADMNLNPHNDSYKPERRSMTQIISDQAYNYADSVLERQYGRIYSDWMKKEGYEADPNGRGNHLRKVFARPVKSTVELYQENN